MLKENAGTQNEGSSDTKANVEEVDKTRIEDKRETKTKGEKTELRVRPCATGLIGPGSVWNSWVYEGGADHRIKCRLRRYSDGNTKRSPMDVGVGTKRRVQNPKCKHDTEGEGATAKLP